MREDVEVTMAGSSKVEAFKRERGHVPDKQTKLAKPSTPQLLTSKFFEIFFAKTVKMSQNEAGPSGANQVGHLCLCLYALTQSLAGQGGSDFAQALRRRTRKSNQILPAVGLERGL
jgi:hypothetical protein